MPVLEPGVVTAIEDYFRLLQAHASAEQMLADVLTSDFQTGFVGGHMWTGEQGLREFLSARAVFFDESHQLLQIFEVALEADGRVRARTRLRFFLRRLEPGAARSEEYTGDAFHTWIFDRGNEGRRGVWRRSWLTASPTSTTRRNGFSRCLSKASTLNLSRRPRRFRGSRGSPTLRSCPFMVRFAVGLVSGRVPTHPRCCAGLRLSVPKDRSKGPPRFNVYREIRASRAGVYPFSSFGRGEESGPHYLFEQHSTVISTWSSRKPRPTHSSEYQ
jgi:hypothetical protein